METFRLYQYSFTKNDEDIVVENEDEQAVVKQALELSYSNGFYTYRLEKIIDGERTFEGFRFFCNGREFTDWIKKSIQKYNQ